MFAAFRHSLQQPPLRLVLVLPFLLEIAAAVGLVGYFSYRHGQQAVQDLASQLRAEVTGRISQHLDAYLANPLALNRLNAAALEMGLLDPQNFETLGQFFWQQMQIYDVGYLSYGDPAGNFVGIERLNDGSLLFVESYPLADPDRPCCLQQVYRMEADGQRGPLVATNPNYDHRQEA